MTFPFPVYTARYQNPTLVDRPEALIRVTLGAPRFKLPYQLQGDLRRLAPRWSYFRSPFDVYREHYLADLDRLGVDGIVACIARVVTDHDRPGAILLCFEDLRRPKEWCHRRLFADWWEERTGQVIAELDEGAAPAPEPPPLSLFDT